MALYYDTRIRATVVERWEKARIPSMEATVRVTIPDSDIEPHESSTFKDPKIPLTFKCAIAQELFDKETDEIKEIVRSKRSEGPVDKTVYNTDGEERMELIEEYHKYVRVYTLLQSYLQPDVLSSRNIPALSRNVMNGLKNAEKRCAAQGISWLSCPIPSKGGRPVVY